MRVLGLLLILASVIMTLYIIGSLLFAYSTHLGWVYVISCALAVFGKLIANEFD
jgi:hypothetical protein